MNLLLLLYNDLFIMSVLFVLSCCVVDDDTHPDTSFMVEMGLGKTIQTAAFLQVLSRNQV